MSYPIVLHKCCSVLLTAHKQLDPFEDFIVLRLKTHKVIT
jgi:hypothetical protein